MERPKQCHRNEILKGKVPHDNTGMSLWICLTMAIPDLISKDGLFESNVYVYNAKTAILSIS